MSGTLISIRLKQLARQGKSAWFIYTLLVIGAVVSTWLFYHFCLKPSGALLVCGAVLASLVSVHFSRKDQDFVYHHIHHPQREVFSEYLFFSLPVILAFIITGEWLAVIIFMTGISGLSYIKVKHAERTRLKKLSSLVPAEHFELISGLRRNIVPVVFFYTAALTFCWIRILPLVFLWVITLIVMNWYNTGEPLHVLRANNRTAKEILRRKMIRHSFLLIVFYLPALVLNAFFVEGFFLVNVMFLLLQAAIICFAINYKYGNYTPDTTDNGSILTGLMAFSGIVPFFFPLPFIMSFSYYFKAKDNLNYYLT